MQDVKLIRAETADVALIADLARITWQQHYPSIISQAQIDYMLGLMYAPETLAKQIREGTCFFLIRQNGIHAGFISVTEEKNGEWFLGKFYINQEHAAKGLGTTAFRLLVAETGAKKLKLTVNRQNYKSINFYFKNGFRITEVADFDIGAGYVMNDFVMTWERP